MNEMHGRICGVDANLNRRRFLLVSAAGSSVLAVCHSLWNDQTVRGAPDAGKAKQKHPFDKNVKLTFTDDYLAVRSNGMPTHKTAKFPNNYNPNRILKQNYIFKIPLRPKIAKEPTELPMGPIGVAVNGIPFYNPYTAEGNDAVSGPFAEVFDSGCGHPDQLGRYHYHKYPVCLKSPFHDKEGEHSPLIGLAFDGFAVYGPQDLEGKPPTDLDECNGHEDDERGYHYHVTKKFPYIFGSYRGEVDRENFDGPRGFRGGQRPGPPPGRRPPRRRPPRRPPA